MKSENTTKESDNMSSTYTTQYTNQDASIIVKISKTTGQYVIIGEEALVSDDELIAMSNDEHVSGYSRHDLD